MEEKTKRLRSELDLGIEITKLVGPEHLQAFMEYENEDIAAFRRSATRLRLQLLEEELDEQLRVRDMIGESFSLS